MEEWCAVCDSATVLSTGAVSTTADLDRRIIAYSSVRNMSARLVVRLKLI